MKSFQSLSKLNIFKLHENTATELIFEAGFQKVCLKGQSKLHAVLSHISQPTCSLDFALPILCPVAGRSKRAQLLAWVNTQCM